MLKPYYNGIMEDVVYEKRYSQVLDYCNRGLSQVAIARNLGMKHRQQARQLIIEYGLYQVRKNSNEKRLLNKPKNDDYRSIKLKKLLPIMLAAEKRGYRVKYGTKVSDFRFEGSKIHVAILKNEYKLNNYDYWIVSAYAPEKIIIAFYPNGNYRFILPLLNPNKKTKYFLMNKKYENAEPNWPKKSEIKRHRAIAKLFLGGILTKRKICGRWL